MIALQNTVARTVLLPLSVTTEETATGVLDTLGFDYAAIAVTLDTSATAVTVLKFEEADGTTYVAITALTGGTATGNFTLPSANTSAAPVVRFNIDTRLRKRYLKLSVTPGEAGIMSSHAVLGRAEQTPIASAVAASVVTA